MKWIIGILFSVLFVGCIPNPNSVSGGRLPGNFDTRMNPQLDNQQINSDEWGGVTCPRGADDQAFRDFLSSGTDVYNERRPVLGRISCTPSNNQGFLIRAQVNLLGQFNSNGDNQNIPMQAQSSYLEVKIFDGPLPVQKEHDFIKFRIEGSEGVVQGNQANLVFADEKGVVTLEGSFTNTEFTGIISFDNKIVIIDGSQQSPGKRGILGNFRMRTTATFFDTSGGSPPPSF